MVSHVVPMSRAADVLNALGSEEPCPAAAEFVKVLIAISDDVDQ